MSNLLNTRIILKNDTDANWSNSTFTPRTGELVVYNSTESSVPPKIKIGDGTTPVADLPFVQQLTSLQVSALNYYMSQPLECTVLTSMFTVPYFSAAGGYQEVETTLSSVVPYGATTDWELDSVSLSRQLLPATTCSWLISVTSHTYPFKVKVCPQNLSGTASVKGRLELNCVFNCIN